MDSVLPTVLVVTIVLLSSVIRAALGFGDVLIAMPLLALTVSLQTATPLVALVSGSAALSMLLKSWRSADLRAAWRLIVSSLVGIPFGLLFLKSTNESFATAVLGLVLVILGLYNLIGPKLPPLRSDKPAYLFGLLSGVLGGAYNAKGPPVVIYGTLRGWKPDSFRATLQCYFLPTTLTVVASHGLAGLWTPSVIELYAYALPAMVLGLFLGGRLSRFLPRGLFDRAIYAFLIVMGLLLVLQA